MINVKSMKITRAIVGGFTKIFLEKANLFVPGQRIRKMTIDFSRFAKSVRYQAQVLYRLGIKIPEIAIVVGLSQCRIREMVRFYNKKSSRRKAHLWRSFLGYKI